MSSKPTLGQLPPGMPDPEAIFQSWWPIIIALVGGFIYGLRQYFRGARCTSELQMDDKVAIITGGNGGIGQYIAADFAKRGCKVYLACRDDKSKETEEVLTELKRKTKSDKIVCMKCDLSSLKSVRDFVAAFKKKEENLHYLVNNAGVMMHPQQTTDDKMELHWQVNYLGHFLLTHLLLDTLKKSSPSRIINTTAPAYQLGTIDFDDLHFEKREYQPSAAYAQSKLAVLLFTKEFAKQISFEDSGLAMNCVVPGVVRTGIHRHMPFRKSAFISLTFAPFVWYMMKHPEDGAQTTIFCCLADALTTVSGFLYKECKRETYTDNVKDTDEIQEKLWKETLKALDIDKFGEEK